MRSRALATIALSCALAACSRTPPSPAGARPAVDRSAPRPWGPLARLRPGMSAAEAQAIAPQLFAAPEHKLLLDGVSYWIDLRPDGGEVRGLHILGPDLAAITDGWVKPRAHDFRCGSLAQNPCRIWLDPAEHLRVVEETVGLERDRLDFTRYTPVASLLGDGPTLPFETRPVLLADFDQVASAFKGRGAVAVRYSGLSELRVPSGRPNATETTRGWRPSRRRA